MIKKFLVWLIRRYSVHKVIKEMQIKDQINKTYAAITSNGAIITTDAIVYNQQNNSRQISVGRGTIVSGTLLVFKYGGKIIIGEYSYLGDHSRIWSGQSVKIGNHVFVSHNVNI